jgi:hypothetical protein
MKIFHQTTEQPNNMTTTQEDWRVGVPAKFQENKNYFRNIPSDDFDVRIELVDNPLFDEKDPHSKKKNEHVKVYRKSDGGRLRVVGPPCKIVTSAGKSQAVEGGITDEMLAIFPALEREQKEFFKWMDEMLELTTKKWFDGKNATSDL